MKNKFLTILLAICLIIPCTIVFTACDLSHKHYCNEYGYCNNCKTDTCVVLTRDGTNYSSKEAYAKSGNNKTYFKFVGNGENGLKFTVNTNSAQISLFQIYTKTNTSFYHRAENDYTTFIYNYTFTQGETYYIKLSVVVDGYVSIQAQPIE